MSRMDPSTKPLDQRGRPKALLLDFYGTLTSLARKTIEDICQHVMDDMGIDGEAAAVAEDWGRYFFRLIEQSNHDRFRTLYECERDSLIELLDAMGHGLDGDAVAAADAYMRPMRAYLRRPPIHDDVFDVLKRIDAPICLVTNADRGDVLAAIRHHGLDFDEVVTSEEARCYKPESGIFELALKRTGWRKDEIIHAGDSRHSDVEGANRLGITSVLIDRAGRVSDVGQAVADYTFRDLRGLLTLFDGNRSASRADERWGGLPER